VGVGAIDGTARQELDVSGSTVIPGFVDVHTHYDAQASWDTRLQPSSWHGVTTVVAGNCGVGFAPVRPGDHDRLIELMEGVEDIPGVALAEGLTWDWRSFPDYMDILSMRSYDVDVAVQVPHAALRVYAMGDRAAAREQATTDEITVMARLVAEAVKAGALGFSTSRTIAHKSRSGEVTPSYDAGHAELVEIARALGQIGSGVIQVVTDWPDNPVDDFALIAAMLMAGRRPISISLFQAAADPELYKQVLRFLEEMNGRGYQVRGQVAARAIGLILGLECSLHPFVQNPVWQSIAHLPVSEQAQLMADPGLRARMLAAQHADAASRKKRTRYLDVYERMFELTDPPDYEPDLGTSILRRSEACGTTPEEVALDVLMSHEGKGMIYEPSSNFLLGHLEPVREMLAHPYTIPALSDGGAHLGTICDASFPTTLLQHWVRDRPTGTFELSYIIHRQCRATALAVGLGDRGLIAPGYKADVNVLDLESLRLHKPELWHDLPGGGARLMQRAEGYRHTFVAGVETYRDGEAIGPLPGRLVRGSRPGPSPARSRARA